MYLTENVCVTISLLDYSERCTQPSQQYTPSICVHLGFNMDQFALIRWIKTFLLQFMMVHFLYYIFSSITLGRRVSSLYMWQNWTCKKLIKLNRIDSWKKLSVKFVIFIPPYWTRMQGGTGIHNRFHMTIWDIGLINSLLHLHFQMQSANAWWVGFF